MKFRKIIAVMAAVLMLCSIIPMGAMVSAAGAVYSENFEAGDLAGWSSSTSSIVSASEFPVANSAAGNYAMKFVSTNYHYTNYTIAVEKNTTYRVTFSFLSGDAARPLNVRVRTNDGKDLALNQYPGSATDWETHTLVFNSGNYRNLYFRFQAAHSTGTYYIDNLSVETFDGTIKDDGLLQNGDFETGARDNWYGSVNTAVVDDPTGAGQGKVLQANETKQVNFISQTADVTKGDKYVLSFKVYGYASVGNSAFFLRLGSPSYTSYVLNDITHTLAGTTNVSDTWTTQIRMNMNDKVGAWQTVTVPFTALKDGSIQIAIYNYRANAGQYYFDDFVLRKSQNDGHIYNGNFETGYNKDSWKLYEQTTMDTASARSGAYGLHTLYPAGSWAGIAKQTISNLEVGKTYGVKFWYKAIQGGVNVNIQDSAGTKIADLGWKNKTSWTQVSGTFVATETTATLNFSSGGTGAAEEVYVDDVIVYEVKDPSNDGYIINGDFDCGSTNSWSNINSNSFITYDPAQVHDGIFAMALYTDGGWGGVGNQTVKNLEVGNQYYISAWVRSDGAYINGTLKDSAGTRLADISIKNNMPNWTKYDVKFTATETTATLNFNGPGKADYAGYGYVDSIQIVAVCDRDGHTPGAAADCTNDQYCTVCGDVLATAVGHDWADATCTAPKTCNTCGATEGDALGHTPGAAADCTNDQTCTVCGEVLNAALGHDWADADCDTPKTCSVCGATEGEALGHSYTETSRVDATCGADGSVTYTCGNCGDSYSEPIAATGEHVYFDDCSAICEVCGYEREAGHNVIHVEAKAATCTAMGNIEYWYCDACGMAWLDEACTMNTNLRAVNLPMAEHTYFDDCSAICEVCGYEREAGHNVIHVEAKAATCTAMGNIEYWYCDVCGMAWLDEACTMNTNLRAVNLPMAEHTYFDDCSAICEVCGYEREAGHNVIHVEAKAATCTEMGNIEYWYCDVCGMAWLDEACTMNTNLRAVNLPMAEHTYNNVFDVDCDACGAIREVETFITNDGTSASEDVRGVAARFTLKVDGMAVEGKSTAIYDTATVNGYKLISMGAIASNGVSEKNIPVVYLCDDDVSASAKFAIRVINIPEGKENVEITFTPYFVVEIDGEQVTIYGEAQSASYADKIG